MLVKDAARIDAAEVLREHGGPTYPIDPFAIAKRLWFKVEITSLRPEISGAIVAKGPEDVTILIEESDAVGRQTLTCAHELGHFFERKRNGDLDFSFEEWREPGHYDLHEFYADELAGNLLMPEKRFKEVVRQHGSDYLIAAEFGVSPAAVRKRRQKLGL